MVNFEFYNPPYDIPLVVSREFEAPREMVWKALTERDRLAQWMAPADSNCYIIRFDFRPGGSMRYHLFYTAFNDMFGKEEYLEIQPPERIVYLDAHTDPFGGLARADFLEGWPLQIHCAATLKENKGKTMLTIVKGPYNATDEEIELYETCFALLKHGQSEYFDRLGAYLEKMKAES